MSRNDTLGMRAQYTILTMFSNNTDILLFTIFLLPKKLGQISSESVHHDDDDNFPQIVGQEKNFVRVCILLFTRVQ